MSGSLQQHSLDQIPGVVEHEDDRPQTGPVELTELLRSGAVTWCQPSPVNSTTRRPGAATAAPKAAGWPIRLRPIASGCRRSTAAASRRGKHRSATGMGTGAAAAAGVGTRPPGGLGSGLGALGDLDQRELSHPFLIPPEAITADARATCPGSDVPVWSAGRRHDHGAPPGLTSSEASSASDPDSNWRHRPHRRACGSPGSPRRSASGHPPGHAPHHRQTPSSTVWPADR